ncbi:MAG: hypothetical protein ACI8RZ_001021 [Myxococcota bacterium]|jgi:hypothetical protein
MSRTQTILAAVTVSALCLLPVEAQAGWQGGRRAKCVKPDSAITAEQQQSLSAAVRGGTPVWNAAGEIDQASASSTTNVVLSQGAFNQAWIRYELCIALDNNHIDQATYNRLLEQSLMGSMNTTPVAATPTPVATTPTPVVTTPTPVASTEAAASSGTAWMEQIQAQTQLRSGENYANMGAYGYVLLDVAKTDLLSPAGVATVPLNLPSGYEYAVMGVCDNDCSDLDLTVLKGGLDLSVDTSTDDWPVVKIMPTGSSDYAIKVTMYQCATSTCGYQLTVWQRPVEATPEPVAAVATGSDPVSINSSTQLQGALVSGDHTLPNGEWSDRYTLSLQSGQLLNVSMTSTDIDTYLVAQAPSGATESNDDCDGDRNRSCLSFTALESGNWTIYATSYEGADEGSYDLQVEAH